MKNTLLALCSLAALACDGEVPPIGGDPAEPGLSAGQAVFTAAVITFVADNAGGGFRPPPPAGSTCAPGAAHYTLTVVSGDLAWTRCLSPSDTDPYKETKGQRRLSAAELKDLLAVLGALRVVAPGVCGADKQVLTLESRTAKGSYSYIDSFYSCNAGGKAPVDNIDSAFTKLAALAQ